MDPRASPGGVGWIPAPPCGRSARELRAVLGAALEAQGRAGWLAPAWPMEGASPCPRPPCEDRPCPPQFSLQSRAPRRMRESWLTHPSV